MRRDCRITARPPATATGAAASPRAFTLLELLVALAMSGIIAGSLYSALRIGFRARTSAEAAVEPVRTAELATALLRADFESALPARGTLAGAFVGQDLTGDGGLPADTVNFFTLGNPREAYAAALALSQADPAGPAAGMAGAAVPSAALPAEARQVEIGLAAYPGPGGVAEQVLVRRVKTNLLAQVVVEPEEEVLCRGVRSVSLRYYDGLAWQDTWDSTMLDNAIPAAVELVIELDRSRDGQEKIVRFPRVFLLSCSSVTPSSPAGPADAGTGTGTGGTAP